MTATASPRAKVLLFVTSTAGGAGLHSFLLAKHLCRQRFDLSIAFGPGYPLDERFLELDVPVHVLSVSRKIRPATNLRGFWQVWRLLRKERFDAVVTACSIAGFLGRAAAVLARVHAVGHIIHVYACRPFQNPWKKRMYWVIEKLLDPWTHRYAAVSEATKRYGVEQHLMRPDKVDVIHNAIDLTDKKRLPREEACRALGLDPERPIVGTLSRCEPQKGLTYLLAAAAELGQNGLLVQFVIVGEGPLLESLKREAQQRALEDRVHFLGWRDDIPRVLSCFDVFCQASLWEQAPLALVEAMAMEVPVVATDVDGTSEIVAKNETGLLVPPKDPSSLAAALAEMLSDLERARAMGRAARRRVEERFSAATMVHHYEEFLARLIERN